MGDYADDAIDRDFADLEDEIDNIDGRYDPYELCGQDLSERKYRPILKTCFRCKTGGLHWTQINGKWRLCDEKGEHKCGSSSVG